MRTSLLLIAALGLAPAVAAQDALGGVVINELGADPTGTPGFDANDDGAIDSGDDEFVELYNVTGSPVDISGFELREDFLVFTFPSGTSIPAGGYVTVVDNYPSAPAGFFSADGSLGLSNGGDNVYLCNPSNGQYVELAYGSATVSGDTNDLSGSECTTRFRAGETAVGTGDGQSIQRSPDGSATFEVGDATPGSANVGTVDEPNEDPEASFTFSTMGLTVDFTDTSTDSDGTIQSWSWSFGDGMGTSMMQNPTYTYASAGTYTVTLTVTDNGGDTDTATQSVTVEEEDGGGGEDGIDGSLANGTCEFPRPSETDRCFLQATGTNGTDMAQRYTVFVVIEGPGEFERVAKRGEIKLGAGESATNPLSFRTFSSDPDGDYDAVLLAEEGSVAAPSAAAIELDRFAFQKGTNVLAPQAVAMLRTNAPLTAFPNPVAGQATLRFGVAESAVATLAVYDALGREVARPVDGTVEGMIDVQLDAAALPAGLYVARLVVDGRVETTQLSVVR